MAQRIKNPASIHEDVGLIPGLTQWFEDPALLSAVVSRFGTDLALLRLRCVQAAAAPTGPLAWELPYVTGVRP